MAPARGPPAWDDPPLDASAMEFVSAVINAIERDARNAARLTRCELRTAWWRGDGPPPKDDWPEPVKVWSSPAAAPGSPISTAWSCRTYWHSGSASTHGWSGKHHEPFSAGVSNLVSLVYAPAMRPSPAFPEADVNISPAPPSPTAEEIALARESGRALSTWLQTRADPQQIALADDQGAAPPVRVPASALRLLVEILTEIGAGNAVRIVPTRAELTTEAAADLLSVSHPFLLQLLERGDLPFPRVGRHRRLCYQDVLAYQARIDAARHQALDALVEQAQALGMGYE